MDEVSNIVKDIKAGQVSPIYFLMGDEPYFIDKLAGFIEDAILTEEEKGFNLSILYGRDSTTDEIVMAAKRYPMMSDKQVIIVREAQDLVRTIDNLEPYAANPMRSTVLVVCFKYKTLDKRKKIYKSLQKNAVLFESKKLYESDIPKFITKTLKSRGYDISHKAAVMLTEFLGTDLSRINNELNKLLIILPKGSVITDTDIEKNIGISKDYNNYELRNAIANGNKLRAYQIAQYFKNNPKNNPLVVTTTVLYNFFSQLLQYHALKDKSQKGAMQAMNINKFEFGALSSAASRYSMKKTSAVISSLRLLDVKTKGVGSQATDSDLLRELLAKIL